MKKIGIVIFLIATLFLATSAVHAQLDCTGDQSQISNVNLDSGKTGICGGVYNVDLNGQGNYLTVCANQAFSVALDFSIWCWVAGNHRRQIMIGIDDDPFWCVYDGVPPELPGLSRHDSVTIAIPKPGTYTLSWMITFCDNVGDAGDRYRSRPDLREKIGTIKVTDCSGGIYDRYCEVFAISLNGQDNLEIGPGGLVRITVYYELWNADTCPECTQQIVIGLDDNPMYCAYDGVPGIHPGIYDHDQVFYEMTAPTTPGIYNIMWTSTSGCTCAEAKNLYRTGPNFRKKIATIKVIGDEDWKCIHYKWLPEDLYEMTNISFYQRGNDLLVQINDTDFWGLRSGSVSISVDESIDVFYNTTNVSGLHYKETDYRIIKPEMSLEERSLLFVVGLLSEPIGKAIGIVQYAQDVIPDEVDWYAECGTKNIPSPKRLFDEYGTLNERDTIIIPWYKSASFTPVNSIRVHCPKMTFPEPGIYDIVFRVDYIIAAQDVRYDVALPINVS